MVEEYYERIKYIFSASIHSNGDLGLNIDMRRDWKILCAVFLILVAAVLAGDIYLFYGGYGLRDRGVGGNVEDVLKLDSARLNKVISDWQDREVRFNKILEEKETLIDPSL